MLINEKAALSTSRVLLTPYCKHHVPKYHEWMRDPAILEATASEPLSLEEEYAMQASWKLDSDKLTFIICAPVVGLTNETIQAGLPDVSGMIGDINLFLTTTRGDDGENAELVAELELMIATKEMQGLGYGKSALLTFLRYITDHEKDLVTEFASASGAARKSQRVSYLCVKIGEHNHRSIRLFEDIGFVKTIQKPSYFGEFELRREPFSSEAVDELLAKYNVEAYSEMTYVDGQG